MSGCATVGRHWGAVGLEKEAQFCWGQGPSKMETLGEFDGWVDVNEMKESRAGAHFGQGNPEQRLVDQR